VAAPLTSSSASPSAPSPESAITGLKAAKTLASALPDLLVEARKVAMTVASGWHGRRQAGSGETFWQFRPFGQGESVTRIDWRRSARDDHLYVREREWEAAHTVWVWADLSASMDFRSRLAPMVKRDRAAVLMLALAELLARSGERVGLPGVTRPTAHRAVAERIATALPTAPVGALPDTAPVRRFAEVVVIGDLLDPIDAIAATLDRVAAAGARAHLVQVLDPSEETFPFAGRTEFRDPETGFRLTAGRAETWADAYRQELSAHRDGLRRIAERQGASFLVHHTDRPAAEPLLALHARLASGGRA
jgi:uncharacterized protein (DUF58 family)